MKTSLMVIIVLLTSCGNFNSDSKGINSITGLANKEEGASPIYNEKTIRLIQDKRAFPVGSYAKGEIPQGLYAFLSDVGGYYSEEANGQILDNENFTSFGYVYVHGIGDIKTGGLLVKYEYLNETGYNSAKAYYENLTNQSNYNFSGLYKVGVDITPGIYILESVGTGYMEVSNGPVGNSEIIINDNFNGRKTVSLKLGQYLKLTNVKVII